MNTEREDQVTLVLCIFTRLLKEFNFGLEVYKDGNFVFVDSDSGDRYKVSAGEFQELYEKIEVQE